MHETDGSVLAVEAEEQEHVVCIVRAVEPQPISETVFFFSRNVSKAVLVDLYTPLGQQYLCMGAGGIMDVFPRIPLRILIVNASSFIVSLSKHQRVAITYLPLLAIFRNKSDGPYSYSVSQHFSNLVNIVHYKRVPDCPQKIN